jgi:hypothetical protein
MIEEIDKLEQVNVWIVADCDTNFSVKELQEDMIDIDGKRVSKETIKEALKNYFN